MHLTDEKIDVVGQLARSASPAVILLQDARRPQMARASTIKQLDRACPDYKVFLGNLCALLNFSAPEKDLVVWTSTIHWQLLDGGGTGHLGTVSI